jgi:F0F1-type ATP synthase membrane subunit c/vacuolar-type H+-ATPase subunit K
MAFSQINTINIDTQTINGKPYVPFASVGNGILLENAGIINAIPDGTVGQVLTTGGSNNPSWQSGNVATTTTTTVVFYETVSLAARTGLLTVYYTKIGKTVTVTIPAFGLTSGMNNILNFLFTAASAIPAGYTPAAALNEVYFPLLQVPAGQVAPLPTFTISFSPGGIINIYGQVNAVSPGLNITTTFQIPSTLTFTYQTD